MSFEDISEEINLYYNSIPIDVLEKTVGVHKYQRKSREPIIYTRYSGESSTSVLEIMRKINLSDQGTLNSNNYFWHDWEETYYKERGDEYNIRQQYWIERGEQQNVTTYCHYQDHVFWGTATTYKNLTYEVPGIALSTERACKKPRITREEPVATHTMRTVQEIFEEEGLAELQYQYPEQGINQPVGTFKECVRILVHNNTLLCTIFERT
jgi:hypothetical protein